MLDGKRSAHGNRRTYMERICSRWTAFLVQTCTWVNLSVLLQLVQFKTSLYGQKQPSSIRGRSNVCTCTLFESPLQHTNERKRPCNKRRTIRTSICHPCSSTLQRPAPRMQPCLACVVLATFCLSLLRLLLPRAALVCCVK